MLSPKKEQMGNIIFCKGKELQINNMDSNVGDGFCSNSWQIIKDHLQFFIYKKVSASYLSIIYTFHGIKPFFVQFYIEMIFHLEF